MRTQLAKRAGRMPSSLEDFLTSSWNDWFNDRHPERVSSVPSVNISDREDDYLVSMAAPGLKKEDFKIELEGNMMSISSENEVSSEQEEEKIMRQEYSYSSFERCFALPKEVDKDKIDAQYKDGVLEILLPKKEEARKMVISKNIEVT